MTGYRNMPEETSRVLHDGWLYTGDIGELDDDGYLYIRDRKKDMINVGGYKVYPREVEEVLYRHPGVTEAAVIGVPDAFRGEVVHAFVTVKDERQISADALLKFCGEQLIKYKLPSQISLMVSLPKTPVGKIDKNALRNINRKELE